MIAEGYAWAYDGGSKNKNFQELIEIRKSFGTYFDEAPGTPSSVE